MTRDQYVAICKGCTNRGFDKQHGIVCGITNQMANYEGTCSDYTFDIQQKQKEEERKAYNELQNEAPSSNGSGTRDIIVGGLWCVGGLIGTLADTGYIFWGAILFGGFQLFRGLTNMGK